MVLKSTKRETTGNRAFRLSELNQQRLRELAETLGITENGCINLAIADLWAAKRMGAPAPPPMKRVGV